MNKKILMLIIACILILSYIVHAKHHLKHSPQKNNWFGKRTESLIQKQSTNYAKEKMINSSNDTTASNPDMQVFSVNYLKQVNQKHNQKNSKFESNGIVIHNTSNDDNNDDMQGATNSESKPVLFISDYDNNQVDSCIMRLDGTFNCKVALTGLYGPENIVIIQSKLYITNLNNSNISVCDIGNNGQIYSCNSITVAIKSPVNFFYANSELFISDMMVKSTETCQIDASGNIISCNKSTGILPELFKTVNYNEYSYSTNWSANAINQCINMYSTACNKITDPTIVGPLTIKIFSGYAYIANCSLSTTSASCGNHNVIQCKVQQNGNFTSCQILSDDIKFPVGIAQFTVPAPIH